MNSNIQTQLSNIKKLLMACAVNFTGNQVDAEDLYQDTALRIVTNANKFQVNSNFKAWAITIMRNTFINEYRKRSRRRTLSNRNSRDFYINLGRTSRNGGEQQIAYEALVKLVNGLSEDFRGPFWMSYQGYKYDEIAKTLNLPLGTVKSRIFFARKKLQSRCRRY